MKPQTKHALVGLAVTIGLLATFISLERYTDGTTLSMKIVIGLIVISVLYTFMNGINANPVQPRPRNTAGPFVRHITGPNELDDLHKEAQDIIGKFKK